MIIIDRHTTLGDKKEPFQATLRVKPSSRTDLINVRGKLLEEFGQDFAQYTRSFYISNHTTAGYLDQRLAEALEHDGKGIESYLQIFRELFPPRTDYVHDTMDLREELSEEQRINEPLNADSHLAFIGAGLRNSASYKLAGAEPVWFVELDGVHVGGTRHRRTTVIAYNGEEEVVRTQVRIAASPRPIDAQNLRDPAYGFLGTLERIVKEHGVSFGRFDVTLTDKERHAGLTVNEYEPLLMNHDLREAVSNPFRFMAKTGKGVSAALRDPRSLPAKAVNFAQFDAFNVLKFVVDRVGLRESLVERVVNRAVALPVSHFLGMKRGISLPVLDRSGSGVSEIGWGTYQSPILVQWKQAERAERLLNVRLMKFV